MGWCCMSSCCPMSGVYSPAWRLDISPVCAFGERALGFSGEGTTSQCAALPEATMHPLRMGVQAVTGVLGSVFVVCTVSCMVFRFQYFCMGSSRLDCWCLFQQPQQVSGLVFWCSYFSGCSCHWFDTCRSSLLLTVISVSVCVYLCYTFIVGCSRGQVDSY